MKLRVADNDQNVGNIVFEPYIKVEDYTIDDLSSAEYLEMFGITYYVDKEGDAATTEPCENPFQVEKFTFMFTSIFDLKKASTKCITRYG